MCDMNQRFVALVLDFSEEDQVIGFEHALFGVDTFVEVESIFVSPACWVIDVFVVVIYERACSLIQLIIVDNINETTVVSDVLAKRRKHVNELL